MKLSNLFLLLFVTSLFGEPSKSTTNANTQDQLRNACKALLAEPLDPAGLQALLDYSRSTSGIPQLKSRSMAVYTLSALARGDTNLFDRAHRAHTVAFPNDHELISVRPESCYHVCSICDGAGHTVQTVICSTCKGANICAVCTGTGKWQKINLLGIRGKSPSVIKCPKCLGTGFCPDCKGVSELAQECATCKGACFFFERPRQLHENFVSLITSILSIIEREETIVTRIRQAMEETDINHRIRLFEKLLSEYHNRPEIETIQQLLLADRIKLNQEEATRYANAKQVEQDLNALRSLTHAENTKASIVTLREYLASNPDSPHKLEIQSILNDCIARLENNRVRMNWIYAGGGLLVVLFGLSCIHINYFKYTMFPSYSPNAQRLPSKVDNFTDPLTLNAIESKARVEK